MMMAPLGYFSVAGGSHIDVPGKTTGGKYETLKALGVTNNNISIPVGDKLHTVNTTGIDPFNMMLSMAANSGKYIQLMTHNVNYDAFSPNENGEFDFTQMQVASSDILAHTLALTLGFGEILSNSTFLMGVNNLTKDIQNANKAFSGDISGMDWTGKWFNKFSSSFIPGFIGETGKWIWSDDFQKLAVETNEYYLKKLKLNNLSNDYTIFGETIPLFGYHQSTTITPAKELFKKVRPKITPVSKKVSMTLNGIQVSVPLMADELSFFKKKSGDIFNEEMTKLANGDSDYSAVFDAASTTEIERKHIVKYLLSSSRSDARIELLRDKNEDGSENKWYQPIYERAQKQRSKKILTAQDGKALPEDNLIYEQEE